MEHSTTYTEPLAVNEKTAALLISSSPSSLEKDRVRGHLGVPYIKAGRRIFYKLTDLHSWLDKNRVTPPDSSGANMIEAQFETKGSNDIASSMPGVRS